ncbi:arylesterase [Pontibacter beigongshangensis]|uniref:arylesterase n=1 Tax=Pontibacter beigongshangensis TaxID=2574733 RepID=UPI00164F2A33|nr:arylesterase [Pontibacter beigongshangensis]
MFTKITFLSFCLSAGLLLTSCDNGGQPREQVAEQRAKSSAAASSTASKAERTQTILFFGNSLTAGYGLEPDQAFPALIQQRIDSLGLPYKAVNAGLSGETSAGGKSRIDWLLRQPVDVFVLELGANDGLRGISPTETYSNLATIIDKVRDKYPEVRVVLAGMQMPPSMGQQFTKEFREVFTRLAAEKEAVLIPFLLEGVAGERALNQGDGIHPTVEGQKILAQNVWTVIEPILRQENKES